MPTIYHSFTINASLSEVSEAIRQKKGVLHWFTPSVNMESQENSVAEFRFQSGFIRAWVSYPQQDHIRWVFFAGHELMREWIGTTALFVLEEKDARTTQVLFSHSGWSKVSDFFKEWSFRWAVYLSKLKKYLER